MALCRYLRKHAAVGVITQIKEHEINVACESRANQTWNLHHNQPLSCQTLPEGDGSITAAGQDPGVRRPLGVSAHADVSVQAEAQQEAAQQGGVVLAVALQT